MSPAAPGIGPGLLYGLLALLPGVVLVLVRSLLAARIGGLPAALVGTASTALLLWLVARLAGRGLPMDAGWPTRAGMALAALAFVSLTGPLVFVALDLLAAVLDARGFLARHDAPGSPAERAVVPLLLAWLLVPPFLVRRGT